MSCRTAASLAAIAALVASAPRAAHAQNGPLATACAAQALPLRDACQKSVDLIDYFAPQLGALVAGGNTELGRGGATGGAGHFSVGLRVNALRSPVPQVQDVTLSALGATRTRVGVDGAWIGFPVADAAIGVFGGLPVGLTTIGGVDVLVNAAYLPNVSQEQVAIRTDGGSVRFGLGARLGLLRETAFVPGVSLSVLRRSLPTTSITATTDAGDRFGIRDARVRSDSWRLTVSKNLVVIAIAAGVGEDRYRASADVEASLRAFPTLPGGITGGTLADVPVSQRLTRRNYFVDVTLLNLPLAKLVGEIGRTQGGSLPETYNSFDGRRPDQAYTYGSVGVRVGL